VRDGPPTPPLPSGPVPKIELSLVNTSLEFEFGFGNVHIDGRGDEEKLDDIDRKKTTELSPKSQVKALRRRSLTVG
jgi:hypothetical protein